MSGGTVVYAVITAYNADNEITSTSAPDRTQNGVRTIYKIVLTHLHFLLEGTQPVAQFDGSGNLTEP